MSRTSQRSRRRVGALAGNVDLIFRVLNQLRYLGVRDANHRRSHAVLLGLEYRRRLFRPLGAVSQTGAAARHTMTSA